MKPGVLRNLLMRYGTDIGLKNNEMVLLWHILDADWTDDGVSYPTEKHLMHKMGFSDERGIRKILKSISDKDLIEINVKYLSKDRRKNVYRWAKLKKMLIPYWEKEVERAKKESEIPDQKFRYQKDTGSKVPVNGGTNVPVNTGSKVPNKYCNRNTANTTLQQGNGFKETIPKNLNTDRFRKIWREFKEYRKDTHRKMSETAIERMLAKLSKFPESTAIAALETSMENDWQGVFPEKRMNGRKKTYLSLEELKKVKI